MRDKKDFLFQDEKQDTFMRKLVNKIINIFFFVYSMHFMVKKLKIFLKQKRNYDRYDNMA